MSASEDERPMRGEAGESSDSVTASRRSSAALQAATRLECFLQAAFLMILSRQGPRMRPAREEPPRGWAEAMADAGGDQIGAVMIGSELGLASAFEIGREGTMGR